MSDLQWTPVKIKLGQIRPWTNNPRMSTKVQAQRIIRSWRDLGQIQTIAVGPMVDGFVDLYDGHQRVLALNTVKTPDYELLALQSNRQLTEDERKQVAVLLHTATGGWDWNALSGWSAADLREWGMDKDTLKGWQSDAKELTELLNSEQTESADAEPQIDRAAELAEKWHTATGQLWRLGDHRLLIGDCTVRENVERLMGGEEIEFIMADAPYNFEPEGGWTHSNKVRTDFLERIRPLTDFDPMKFFELLNSIEFGSVVFFCGKSLVYQYLKFAEDNKYLNNILVWCKDNPPPLHNNNFIPDLEYIIYVGTENRVFENGLNYKDYSKWYESGIHEGKKEGDNLHPTIKPIALIERLLKVNSRNNVLDPFAGSGTTIIAAHNLNRRCYAMEISEKYGAVILERFCTATGITPELID